VERIEVALAISSGNPLKIDVENSKTVFQKLPLSKLLQRRRHRAVRRATESALWGCSPAMTKHGWLQKKSSGLVSRFQRRYVTQSASTLILRSEERASRCRQYEVVGASPGAAANDLTVKCADGRALLLRAATLSERDAWIQALSPAPSVPVASSVAPMSVVFASEDIVTAPANARSIENGGAHPSGAPHRASAARSSPRSLLGHH